MFFIPRVFLISNNWILDRNQFEPDLKNYKFLKIIRTLVSLHKTNPFLYNVIRILLLKIKHWTECGSCLHTYPIRIGHMSQIEMILHVGMELSLYHILFWGNFNIPTIHKVVCFLNCRLNDLMFEWKKELLYFSFDF